LRIRLCTAVIAALLAYSVELAMARSRPVAARAITIIVIAPLVRQRRGQNLWLAGNPMMVLPLAQAHLPSKAGKPRGTHFVLASYR
jgi:hypothetical protein